MARERSWLEPLMLFGACVLVILLALAVVLHVKLFEAREYLLV